MTINYIIAPGLIQIDDAVTQVWGIAKSDLQIRTRKRTIVEARQVIMWWRIANTKDSLSTIAGSYAGLDHCTALHARETVNNLLETNPDFRGKVEKAVAIMDHLNGTSQKEKKLKPQRVIYIDRGRLYGVGKKILMTKE